MYVSIARLTPPPIIPSTLTPLHPTTALLASGVAGTAGAYQYSTDEGTRRSLYFWNRAFPIFLHYRLVRAWGGDGFDV